MPNILIVEDELIAAEYLKEVLQANGFDVIEIIDNGKEAKTKIPQLAPDIVLMDIMLKDEISGTDVALYLKQFAPDITIVFLTAYADLEMVEYAVASNSYAYLMKPYNENEIINTLKVVTARTKEQTKRSNDEHLIYINQQFTYNIQEKKLYNNNEEIKLSKNTSSLLEILCKNINHTVSQEELSQYVWGSLKNNITIRTQIHRIRTLLGSDIIENVSGLGYIIRSKK